MGATPRDRTPWLEVAQENLSCLLRNYSPSQLQGQGREVWLCLVVAVKGLGGQQADGSGLSAKLMRWRPLWGPALPH